MDVYEFSPIYAPRLMARMLSRNALNPLTRVVLDLEDGLQDLLEPARTDFLKAEGRANLLAFIEQFEPLARSMRLGFRVNAFSTPYFGEDVRMLKAVSERQPIDAILLPKVPNAEELIQTIACLHEAGIAFTEIVPMIETVEGVNNLSAIFAAAQKYPIRALIYGHFDYSLDAGHFPILDHDQVAFWEWVIPLIAQIEQAGFMYVHPPCVILDTEAMPKIAQTLNRLHATCQRSFSTITISPQQTRFCHQFTSTPAHPARGFETSAPAPRSDDELIQLALRTRDVYLSKRRTGYSFVVDPVDNTFIAPHSYLAAMNFLNRMGVQ